MILTRCLALARLSDSSRSDADHTAFPFAIAGCFGFMQGKSGTPSSSTEVAQLDSTPHPGRAWTGKVGYIYPEV